MKIKITFSILILIILALLAIFSGRRNIVSINFNVTGSNLETIVIRTDINRIKKKLINNMNNQEIEVELPQVQIKNLSIVVPAGSSDLIIKGIDIKTFLRIKHIDAHLLKKMIDSSGEGRHVIFRKRFIKVKSNGAGIKLKFNRAFLQIIGQFQAVKDKKILVSLIIFIILLYLLFRIDKINLTMLINPKEITITIIFFIIILFPLFDRFYGLVPSLKLNSKIELKKKTYSKREKSDPVLMDFERFFSDNMTVKKYMIVMNNYFHLKILNTSPIPKIIVGKDGWLFLGKENRHRNQVNYYRNIKQFSPEDLEKWRINLEDRYTQLREMGIRYYFLVAPSKMTIYPEKIPCNIKKYGKFSRFDQLINYIEKFSFFKIIDVRSDLIRSKLKNNVYFKTGSHWNDLGAFIVYRKVMDVIRNKHGKVSVFDLNDFFIDFKLSNGDDFPKMLSIEKYIPERKVIMIPRKKFLSYLSPIFKKNNVNFSYSENQGRSSLKVIYIHDSFITGFKKFFAESFSRVEYFWDYNHKLSGEMIEKLKPDIVIDEMAERFLLDFDPDKLKINY